MDMGIHALPVTQGHACTGSGECGGQPPLQERATSRELEVAPSSGKDDLVQLRQSSGRSVCLMRQRSLPDVLLHGEGLAPPRHRRHGTPVASGAALRFSPIQPSPQPAAEDRSGGGPCDPGGARLGPHDMVLVGDTTPGQDTMETSSSPRPAEPGRGDPCFIPSQSLGLAPERADLLDMGLTSSVVQTLQSARAPSTRAAYFCRWELFMSWCITNHINAVTCLAPEVLRYRQELLEAGKSPSTLRGGVAAIKGSRVGEARLSVDDSGLLSQFMKGAQRLVPHSRRPASPTWDLGRVLSALEQGPFEPLESVSLQWISLKVAFLLAITSAERVGELQALSVHESCCCILPGNTGVVLCPNPLFLPKVLTDFHLNQSVELRSLRPSQEADEGQEESVLCPVRALKIYMQRTAALRRTDQLFICFGPQCLGEPVSKARLSHWVVEAIQQAYRETGKPVPVEVKAHSRWGVSTSWALWHGATLSEICVAATWSTPTTFTQFYCLNVAASTSLSGHVLRATSK